MRIEVIALFLLILGLFLINYPFLDSYVTLSIEPEREGVFVARVVDGDTLKLDSGETIRLLGINTPERGERYYAEAKMFLQLLVENKSIELERRGQDKYRRTLGHVFIDNKHVNVELVEKGFANVYVLEYEEYEPRLREAWESCIIGNKLLCEQSQELCASCIILDEFDYHDQKFTLKNQCVQSCDIGKWIVKEEGRKVFTLNSFILESESEVEIICSVGQSNSKQIFLDKCESLWTATGDTLYLRDDFGKLVLWSNY